MSEIELKDAYIVGELRHILATGEGDMLWINRHHAAALLSAIDSPAPQWQPIEFNEDGEPTNVPADTPILVPPTKRLGMTVAKWNPLDGWETETCSEWVGMYSPKHFQPLPAPPEESP